jgi:sec-independent protein translocase protein TatB
LARLLFDPLDTTGAVMFDLSSSKLLILGIVALLVVGPKELPVLLRTIGKYLAMIRRQADEFRAQFNDAIKETELDQIKKEVETMGSDMERTMREAEMSVEKEVQQANAELEASIAKDNAAHFGQDLGPVDTASTTAPQPQPTASAAPAAEPAVPAKVGA